MNNIPIYYADIIAENDGVYTMSLVDCPATEFDWLCFSENKKEIQKFSIQNEDEHILMGVVMCANTPIYRRNGDFEYYIQYAPQTLEKMAEKMLNDNTFNNIDLQHNGKILPKGIVMMRELFIKNSERGIAPKGFENLPDGSLMCVYKINDEELWQACKNGTFKGYSLEGMFSISDEVEVKPNTDEDAEVEEVMSLIEKIKNKIYK